eukprot:gene27795-36623_t
MAGNIEPEMELKTASTLNIPIEANISLPDAVKSATLGGNPNNYTIESLLKDLKARDEAIIVCGHDIRALRKEKNDLLDNQREAAAKEEKANKMLENSLNLSSTEIKNLSNETMVRLINKLTDKVAKVNYENQALIETMQEAKQSINSLVDLKAKYKELENAHLTQSKQLQKMQGQMKKVDTYKRTIETQEKVISKMQRVIESSVNSTGDSSLALSSTMGKDTTTSASVPSHQESTAESEIGPHTEDNDIHVEHNEELETQIIEYKKKIEELETQVSDLQSSKSEELTKESNVEASLAEATRKIDILEAELISKGYRIEALQEQLESSAKEYSDEISKLRTRVFDLEMNSAALEGSDGTNDLSDIDFPEIRNLEEVMALSKQSSLLAEAASVPVGSAVSAANALRSSQSAKVIADVIADGVSIPLEAEGISDTTPTLEFLSSCSGGVSTTTATTTPPEQEERNSNASAKDEREQNKEATPEEKKVDELLKPQKSEKELPQPPPALPIPSPESKKVNGLKNLSLKKDEITSSKSQGSVTKKLSMDLKRTKDGVEVVTCCLAVYLNVQHKWESSPYEYSIHKVEISGFLEEDMKGRFRPFVDISVGDDGTWSCSTAPMQDAGSEVQWLFPDKKQAFMITEGQKRVGYWLNCAVNRLANEDDDKTGPSVYLLGEGKARL